MAEPGGSGSGTPQRAYVASHFALDLDGAGIMGFLRSYEGGGIKTDIMSYQHGAAIETWRQVGRLKYDDITLTVGMGMSDKFYDWIACFFTRDVKRKNGSIILADFNYKERAKRTFSDALISEVQIPTLDGSSKDAAYMTVKIVPEAMAYEALPGENKIECPPGLTQPNKLWHAANFRFTIDGFEDSFKRVLKIDGFTIKQQILEYPAGHQRRVIRVPGKLEIPNINVYVPVVDAQALIDQVGKRLVTYDAPDPTRMTGAIEFVGSNGDTLATLSLKGVDITSIEPQKGEANGENFAQVKFQLAVEELDLEYEDGTVQESA